MVAPVTECQGLQRDERHREFTLRARVCYSEECMSRGPCVASGWGMVQVLGERAWAPAVALLPIPNFIVIGIGYRGSLLGKDLLRIGVTHFRRI